MIVYIEYVLINNFIIDLLLLKTTFATTGVSPKHKVVLFSALLGAVISLITPLLSGIKTIYIIVKILSGFLIILTANKYLSFRAYFINATVFFCYTFLTGGVIMGVFNLFNLDYNKEPFIALMMIPVYLAVKFFSKVVKYIYRRKEVCCRIYKVELKVNKKTVACTGFFDTGNGLYDGDSPVIVCSTAFFKELLKEDLLKVKIKKILVNTVNGEKENLAVKIDEIKIYIGDKPNIYNDITMVATKCVGDGYDIILHPALYKENNYAEFVKEVKKVC